MAGCAVREHHSIEQVKAMNLITTVLKSCAIVVHGLVLVTCVQNVPAPVEPTIPLVGSVNLDLATVTPSELLLLDIGVRIFEAALEEETNPGYGGLEFATIRENETQYLPYVLRNTLIDANQWGAVRVLPQDDPSMDLLLSGTVLRSDGQELQIHIKVQDSSGREWLNKKYADLTLEEDFPISTRYTPGNRFEPESFTEPFQDLYNQINNDLVAVRAQLSDQNLGDIALVSQMAYAADLSPDSFAHTLKTDANGYISLVSLPANNDPMMARVQDMRVRHHLFIDTVDEYYQALYEDMQPSYVIWRRYSYDQIAQDEAATREAYDISRYSSSSGYLTLIQRYDRFRWSKIYEVEFSELATGFNREIAPAILELNKQVHGLSGTMEEQYIQWRRILRQLFTLETGRP